MSVPDSEGSQLLPEDLGPGEPVSGLRPLKKVISLSKQGNQGLVLLRLVEGSRKFRQNRRFSAR